MNVYILSTQNKLKLRKKKYKSNESYEFVYCKIRNNLTTLINFILLRFIQDNTNST